MDGYEPQRSQRNIDVDEPLEPAEPHELIFPVGNPTRPSCDDHPGPDPAPRRLGPGAGAGRPARHAAGRGARGQPDRHATAGEPLPEDGTPIVDVEAFVEGQLIGGFRKIFRPPVPIHRPRDPIYAESEILIHPYPPRAHEPTELGVEIRNPTDEWQTVTVTFSSANFGIGLPFTPIHEPIIVAVPPGGTVWPGTMWMPPDGGLWCIQVEIELPGFDEIFYSQRNIDVGEPLEPTTPHARPFLVGNPTEQPVTITLGLVPHFPDWGLELSAGCAAGHGAGRGAGGHPDRHASERPARGRGSHRRRGGLCGWRAHRWLPQDLPPAGARPPAQRSGLCRVGDRRRSLSRRSPASRSSSASRCSTPPTRTGSSRPPLASRTLASACPSARPTSRRIPSRSLCQGMALRGGTSSGRRRTGTASSACAWSWRWKGTRSIWSQRNIDVGEPLQPGEPHALVFPVGTWPHTEPVTVTLGLINHRDGWDVSLSAGRADQRAAGPAGQRHPDGHVPRATLSWARASLSSTWKPLSKASCSAGSASSTYRPSRSTSPTKRATPRQRLSIEPYPPRLGKTAKVSAVLQNNGPTTIRGHRGVWLGQVRDGDPLHDHGYGALYPHGEAAPGMTVTASVTWTPAFSGSTA